MEPSEQLILTGSESKREFLNDFLKRVDNKFLYLYGDKNTGKQFYLEDIAKEVFADKWKSVIYIRMDEGQKFPYKLHAHKVESSGKVILISNSIDNYNKWKEFYPTTIIVKFINDNLEDGLESTENNEAIYKITLTKWKELNQQTLLDYRNSIYEITDECPEIKNKIIEVTKKLVTDINFLNIGKSQYLKIFD